MKRKYKFIKVVFILLTYCFLIHCKKNEKFDFWFTKDWIVLRENLLIKTPIESDINDVRAFLNNNLESLKNHNYEERKDLDSTRIYAAVYKEKIFGGMRGSYYKAYIIIYIFDSETKLTDISFDGPFQ